MARRFPNTAIFIRFVLREILNPWIYLNAGLIGTTICVLTRHYTPIPYCVPLFVQIFTRASVKFRQRNVNALVELPAQTDDPVFIMDEQGDIVLSTGKTKQLFETHAISNIRHLVGDAGLEGILRLADMAKNGNISLSEEFYAEKTDKWYEAKAKPAIGQRGEKYDKILVWFQDISIRKEYDLRLQDLLKFSSSMISKLDQLVKSDSTYDHLAAFMLSDYEAVYITRTDAEENLIGHVFKRGIPFLERSETIIVPSMSEAPILVSRRKARIISDDTANYDSSQAFLKQHPFDPKVLKFIGKEIHNFITYNEADVSIIAFNFKKRITVHEKRFIEVLLNISRIMVMLADLVRENDEQFIQKIIGLSAAAEYSDDMASRHVLRVNAYARMISEKLGMNRIFTDTIGQVAALHDLGKVAMPELIKHPGKLTPEQHLKMQMHTIFGAQIIDRMARYASRPDPRLAMARNIILHHHQIYSGKGYPRLKKEGRILDILPTEYHRYASNEPLAKEEIPVEARVVALADRYDSLRCKSWYKKGLSHEETVDIMRRDPELDIRGEEWHGPELWRLFEELHDEFDHIYEDMKD